MIKSNTRRVSVQYSTMQIAFIHVNLNIWENRKKMEHKINIVKENMRTAFLFYRERHASTIPTYTSSYLTKD